MNRKFKSILSLIICVSLLTACFGCSVSKVDVGSIPLSAEPVYLQSADVSLHSCIAENMTEVSNSGLITLLYDKTSSAVGVRVTNGEESKIWSSLPLVTEGVEPDTEAAVLSLEVVHAGKKYLLNSQDNSLNYGGVYTGNTRGGFEVVYFISDNGECLKKIKPDFSDDEYKTAANGSILFKVITTYFLRDGCFYADMKWVNLGNEDDVLINIAFLEYFGAANTAEQGDYIVVPDGSGAIIDTACEEEVPPVSIAVYGNDIGNTAQMSSVVAAYGMKSGNEAFAAVIEKGDAFATINANKANNGVGYNRVGPAFTFALNESDKETNEFRFVQSKVNDSVLISFRFLSGANTTYAGMAAACREQLIRNYTLSTRSVAVTEYMPLMVNVIGKVKRDGFLGFSKELTDYKEATDILARLKSKGIDNVYLRYSGALSGGLNSRHASDASILSSMGGKSAVKELDKYASGLNFSVFYDIDLVSDSSSVSSLKNLDGSKHSVVFHNPLKDNDFNVAETRRYFTGVSSLEDTVLSVLERFDSLDSSGYCLTDVGCSVFTEPQMSLNRQDAAVAIAKNTAPLSTESPIMVRGGNFYAIKNADVISGLPMNCSRTPTQSYISVPFVQIILHGIVEFTYDEINLSSNSKVDLLRCVEYGAVPGYIFTNNSLDDSDKYAELFSVDEQLNLMYDAYSSVGAVLNDLRGSGITDHYAVTDGVFCTEYESTTRIYVNYTDAPVTVSGITVEPMSFFRVN